MSKPEGGEAGRAGTGGPRADAGPAGGEVPEAVDHPKHYGGADDPFEVIKVLEAWLTREEFVGAMKFNVHKYLARARKKNGAEDYAKAAWYSSRLDDYLRRNPEPRNADESLARQLQRSIERNGALIKENEELRARIRKLEEKLSDMREPP